tara:strand:- start:899 stop:1540 length:642 start_codon:yes stop_codon:yes gene_type:complete
MIVRGNYYDRAKARAANKKRAEEELKQQQLWLSEREPLINALKENSQELLATYLEKTEAWANETIDRRVEQKNLYKKYLSLYVSSYYYDLDAHEYIYKDCDELINTQICFDIGINENEAEYSKIYHSPASFFNREKFIKKSLDNAKAHYENSIIKLAYRIVAKGLNQNNLQFTNSYVGVNIDTIISDGEKQVKAQTICAWGAIQKPHYRYLVK